MKRIYEEVLCDYCTGGFWCVDAWKHDKEEGKVIAVINSITGEEYAICDLDDLAKDVIKQKADEIKQAMPKTLADIFKNQFNFEQQTEFFRWIWYAD